MCARERGREGRRRRGAPSRVGHSRRVWGLNPVLLHPLLHGLSLQRSMRKSKRCPLSTARTTAAAWVPAALHHGRNVRAPARRCLLRSTASRPGSHARSRRAPASGWPSPVLLPSLGKECSCPQSRAQAASALGCCGTCGACSLGHPPAPSLPPTGGNSRTVHRTSCGHARTRPCTHQRAAANRLGRQISMAMLSPPTPAGLGCRTLARTLKRPRQCGRPNRRRWCLWGGGPRSAGAGSGGRQAGRQHAPRVRSVKAKAFCNPLQSSVQPAEPARDQVRPSCWPCKRRLHLACSPSSRQHVSRGRRRGRWRPACRRRTSGKGTLRCGRSPRARQRGVHGGEAEERHCTCKRVARRD